MRLRAVFGPLVFISLSAAWGCSKDYSYEGGPADSGLAKGTILDSNGQCASIVAGTWYNGVIPKDSNFVTISVTVTQPGSYSFSTKAENGVSFAAAGNFLDTGTVPVQLHPTGLFINHEPTGYSYSFDGNTCAFIVPVQDSTGKGLGPVLPPVIDPNQVPLNTWKFTVAGQTFRGPIFLSMFSQLTTANFQWEGYMESGKNDSTIGMSIAFNGTTLEPGTYPTSVTETHFYFGHNPDGAIIFAANSAYPQVMQITVLQYDVLNHTVTGIFSGDAFDFNHHPVFVSNGAFSASFQ